MWLHPDLKQNIVNRVAGEINKESESLCSVSSNSILRETSATKLKDFKASEHLKEVNEKAPTLYSCIRACAVSPLKEREISKGQVKKARLRTEPLSMALSVLLKCRNQQMSAQAYRVGTILWHGGAKTQVSTYPP